jgi:GTP diphosphokinase / guanosine-3',5'-bis(diphosphate) 3'-diphosphatase
LETDSAPALQQPGLECHIRSTGLPGKATGEAALTSDLAFVLEAACFAADRHRDQRRKGADAAPYVNHVLGVARLVAGEAGVANPEVVAAALLHDTVEDTGTTPAELDRRFGPRVAALVMELTDDKALPKDARKRLQIEHAPAKSQAAKVIGLADKLCNLRDLTATAPAGWPASRRQAYFDWAEAVVAGLRGASPALEALVDAELARRGELG